MKINLNIKFSLLFLFFISLALYFSKNYNSGKINNFNLALNQKNKQFVKKYFLPYKLISEQEKLIYTQKKELSKINKVKPYLLDLELDVKSVATDIGIKESNIFLSNKKNLKKYKLTSGFYYGIHEVFPGSGYIDFYKDKIFVLSSRGVLAYSENLTNEGIFKQIENNINDFIGLKHFKEDYRYSIKDLFIFKNKIYLSYTEEIEEKCFNTSILVGDIDYKKIIFKRFFSSLDEVKEEFENSKCIPVPTRITGKLGEEFQPHQSGGRIISFDNNNILFSLGDYRYRDLSQNEKSINGKIIKINLNNNSYEIISMGHRNPQGLFFDRKNNFILETEHGPMGGDEINLIEVRKINADKIQNFGWAIASYGEHYGGKVKRNEDKYKKYPLYKSHSEYGFIEPLKSFVPSIGISEIVKIKENKYVVSSLKDKSLYFFELNKNKELINLERVEVFERIRDLKYKDNKIYLFMEGTSSIGVIEI